MLFLQKIRSRLLPLPVFHGADSVQGNECNGVVPDRNGTASPAKQQLQGKEALRYANILRSRNKFADALQLYNVVLGKEGTNVEALIGKGICLQAQSLPRQAYRKAQAANPSYKPASEFLAIVLTDLGTSLKLAGNTEEGIQKYFEALEVDNHYAPAYYNLGVVYSEMMQFYMALTCYEKAALERPLYAEVYCNMGVIYKNQGELEAAIACYERCLTISPNFEIAKNNMAIALTDLGTKMALSIKPNFSQSLNNLGVVYTVQGKMDVAASMIEKAIIANPTYTEAYNNLANALDSLLCVKTHNNSFCQNRLLAMNYIDEGSNDKLYDAHREWGKRFMKSCPQYTSWDNSKASDHPLIIGYVSPDYFIHSVSYFIEAPLTHHEYTNYKVIVYSGVVKADAKTLRFKDKVLKKGGLWSDIYGIDEKRVASLVREDKVDILVDLLVIRRTISWEQWHADLFLFSLDTFPYAGTTTTCESLYMGVPCVTMAGSVHAHNVGVSLLSKVGLGRLVAKTEDEYVRLALELASDVTALQELRMSLRELMMKSPVCDGEKFTRGLEAAYRKMWLRYCDGDMQSLKRLELLQEHSLAKMQGSEKTAEKTDPIAQKANATVEIDKPTPTVEVDKQTRIKANGVISPSYLLFCSREMQILWSHELMIKKKAHSFHVGRSACTAVQRVQDLGAGVELEARARRVEERSESSAILTAVIINPAQRHLVPSEV
ncbi:hypothetical protein PR202_ga21805 [Eleusine coracana subsp. coracana]|uniref:protein O-GlcNAc transferase n=1 Tax=Eleusine coracana subsp. coracana TaxID=191504 RepID=A0AAV5D1X0_ELECO|nr:hypothetical protein PR202_ga21805 [Eleusine coracana subsp. coracana]